MMQGSTTPGAQGICPQGWHLPSDDEWKILEGTVDSQYGVGDQEWNGLGNRGFDAGLKLKSTSGWNVNGNGTDVSGFTALPGGTLDEGGMFSCGNAYASFWSSTKVGKATACWYRGLRYSGSDVNRTHNDELQGNSVRCLKDN
jgi:uncharacterized protein (TIGR02145 family)